MAVMLTYIIENPTLCHLKITLINKLCIPVLVTSNMGVQKGYQKYKRQLQLGVLPFYDIKIAPL